MPNYHNQCNLTTTKTTLPSLSKPVSSKSTLTASLPHTQTPKAGRTAHRKLVLQNTLIFFSLFLPLGSPSLVQQPIVVVVVLVPIFFWKIILHDIRITKTCFHSPPDPTQPTDRPIDRRTKMKTNKYLYRLRTSQNDDNNRSPIYSLIAGEIISVTEFHENLRTSQMRIFSAILHLSLISSVCKYYCTLNPAVNTGPLQNE